MTVTNTTWQSRLDNCLDEISRLRKDRADALDAITRACRDNPELDNNPHLTEARLCLLG